MRASPRSLLVILGLLSLVLAPSATALAADVPKLAGTWKWSWKDKDGQTHRHVLEVEGIGEKIAARERFDDLPPVAVTNLKIVGMDTRFAVVRGEHRADYTGVVAGPDTINGKVKVTDQGDATEFVWKAMRESSKDAPVQKAPTPPEQ